MCSKGNQYASQRTGTCEEISNCPEITKHQFTVHNVTISGIYQINQELLMSYDEEGNIFLWNMQNQIVFDVQYKILSGEKIRSILKMDDSNVFIQGLNNRYKGKQLFKFTKYNINYLQFNFNLYRINTYLNIPFLVIKYLALIFQSPLNLQDLLKQELQFQIPSDLYQLTEQNQFLESPLFWVSELEKAKSFVVRGEIRKDEVVVKTLGRDYLMGYPYFKNIYNFEAFKVTDYVLVTINESGEVIVWSFLSGYDEQKVIFTDNKYFRVMENQQNDNFVIGADNFFLYKYNIRQKTIDKIFDLEGSDKKFFRCIHLSLILQQKIILFVSLIKIKIIQVDDIKYFNGFQLSSSDECSSNPIDKQCNLNGKIEINSYIPEDPTRNRLYMIEDQYYSNNMLNKNYILYELDQNQNKLIQKKQFNQNLYFQRLTKFGQIIQYSNTSLIVYDLIQEGYDIQERQIYKPISNVLSQIPGKILGISHYPFNKIAIQHNQTDQFIDIYDLNKGLLLYQIFITLPVVSYFENIIIFQSDNFELYIYKMLNQYSQFFKQIKLQSNLAPLIHYYNDLIHIQQQSQLLIQSRYNPADLKTFSIGIYENFLYFVNNIYIQRTNNKYELYNEKFQQIKQNLPIQYSFKDTKASTLGINFYYFNQSDFFIFNKNLDLLNSFKYIHGNNVLNITFSLYSDEYNLAMIFSSKKLQIFNLTLNDKQKISIVDVNDNEFEYINSYIYGNTQSQKIGLLSNTKSLIYVLDLVNFTIELKISLAQFQLKLSEFKNSYSFLQYFANKQNLFQYKLNYVLKCEVTYQQTESNNFHCKIQKSLNFDKIIQVCQSDGNSFYYRQYSIHDQTKIIEEQKITLKVTIPSNIFYNFFPKSQSIVLNEPQTNLIYFQIKNDSSVKQVALYSDVILYRNIPSMSLLVVVYKSSPHPKGKQFNIYLQIYFDFFNYKVKFIDVDQKKDLCIIERFENVTFVDITGILEEQQIILLIKSIEAFFLYIFNLNCGFLYYKYIENINFSGFLVEKFESQQSIIVIQDDKTSQKLRFFDLVNFEIQKPNIKAFPKNFTQDENYVYTTDTFLYAVSKKEGSDDCIIPMSEPYNFMILLKHLQKLVQIKQKIITIFRCKFQKQQYAEIKKSIYFEEEFKYYIYIPNRDIILLITQSLFIKVFDIELESFTGLSLQLPKSQSLIETYEFIFDEYANYLLVFVSKTIFAFDITNLLRDNQKPQNVLQNMVYFRHMNIKDSTYFLDGDFRLWWFKFNESELTSLNKFKMNTPLIGVIKSESIFLVGHSFINNTISQINIMCFNNGILQDQYKLEKQINESQKINDSLFLIQQIYSDYIQTYDSISTQLPEPLLLIIDYELKIIINVECQNNQISTQTIKNLNDKKIVEVFIIKQPELINTDQEINGFYYYDDESFFYNEYILLSSTDSLNQGNFIKFIYLSNSQYFGLIKQKMCFIYEIQKNQSQIPILIKTINECRTLYYSNSLLYYTNPQSKNIYFFDISSENHPIQSLTLPCLNDNKFYFFNMEYVAFYCNLQANIYKNNNKIHQLLIFIPIKNIVNLIFLDSLLFISNQKYFVSYALIKNDTQISFNRFKKVDIEHTNIFYLNTEHKQQFIIYNVLLVIQNYFQTIQIYSNKQSHPDLQNFIPDGFGCFINFNEEMNEKDLKLKIVRIEDNMSYIKSDINFKMLNIYNSNQYQISRYLMQYSSDYLSQYKIRFLSQNSKINNFNVELIRQITYYDVQIIDQYFQYNYEDVSEVVNDKGPKKFTLQNIKLGTNYSIILGFSDLQEFYMSNLTIDGKDNGYSNILFKFQRIKDLTLKNLYILNFARYTTLQGLFSFINIETLTIENIYINNCSDIDLDYMFYIERVDRVIIRNLKARNLSKIEQGFFNDLIIFKINVVNFTTFENFDIKLLKNVSILLQDASYDEDDKKITLKNSRILHNSLNIEDCQINVSLITIYNSKYEMNNSTFNKIVLNKENGSILGLRDIQKKILLNSSRFENSEAESGGTIYLENCEQVVIKYSEFYNNTAKFKGGAIHSDYSKLFITDSQIIDNRSLIGGGVYYFFNKPQFYSPKEENKLLRNQKRLNEGQNNEYEDQINNNYAELFGNNLGSNLNKIVINNIVSFDHSSISAQSDDLIQIEDFRSGDSLQFEFSVLDEEGNSIKFDINKFNEYSDTIKQYLKDITIEVAPANNQKIELSNFIICNYQDFNKTTSIWKSQPLKIICKFIDINLNPNFNNFKQMIILDKPSSISQINIKSTWTTNVNKTYSINIQIGFRKCAVGEIFGNREELTECIPCPKGFYSLIEPIDNKMNECLPCPESAFECYKNKIFLKEGYWRSSNDTDYIIFCKNNPSNCLGSQEGNINYCKEGHIGVLCESCDSLGQVWNKQFMRRKNFECLSCDQTNNYEFILPLIFIIFFLLAYIIISISQTIKMSKGYTYATYFRKTGIINMGTSAVKDSTPFYFKQLMHYMQIASLINKYDFELPEILKFIPMIISLPIENVEYIFDCVLNKTNQGIPVVFIRGLWSLMIPIMYGISLFIIYFILILCIKKLKHNKFFAFNGLFFMLIFLESNVISRLVSIISCRKVGEKSFTQNDSSYECYTPEHIEYSLYIVLPGLLVWTVFIPLAILRSLVKNKNNLDSLFVRFKFGFLYQEFKSKYYYWEFVKSYKKIFIVIFHRLYFDLMQFYSVVICGIVLLYSFVQNRIQPYQQIQFNKIDKILMQIIIVLILINIAIQDSRIIWVEKLGSFIAAFLYNSVIFIFIYQIISKKLNQHFYKQIYFIKLFLKQNVPYICSWISLKKPVNIIRAHNNWKKIKNIVKIKKWQTNNINSQNLISSKISQNEKIISSQRKKILKQSSFHNEQSKNQNKLKQINFISNEKSEINLLIKSNSEIELEYLKSPHKIHEIKDCESKNQLNEQTTNEINNICSALSLNSNTKIGSSFQENSFFKEKRIHFFKKQDANQSKSQNASTNKKAIKVLDSLSDSSETSSSSSSQSNDNYEQVNDEQAQTSNTNQINKSNQQQQERELIQDSQNNNERNLNYADSYIHIPLYNLRQSHSLNSELIIEKTIQRQNSCPDLQNYQSEQKSNNIVFQTPEYSSSNFIYDRVSSNFNNKFEQTYQQNIYQNTLKYKQKQNRNKLNQTNNRLWCSLRNLSREHSQTHEQQQQPQIFDIQQYNSNNQQDIIEQTQQQQQINSNYYNQYQYNQQFVVSNTSEYQENLQDILQKEMQYSRTQFNQQNLNEVEFQSKDVYSQSTQQQINDNQNLDLSIESHCMGIYPSKDGSSQTPRNSKNLKLIKKSQFIE